MILACDILSFMISAYVCDICNSIISCLLKLLTLSFFSVFAFTVATSNIPLSTPDHVSNATTPSGSVMRPTPVPSSRSAPQSPSQSKLDSLRAWSFNTYKFTRQLLSERLGRGTRTVDAELEAQIELLRDTQLKYANILRLARALSAHFYQVGTHSAAVWVRSLGQPVFFPFSYSYWQKNIHLLKTQNHKMFLLLSDTNMTSQYN